MIPETCKYTKEHEWVRQDGDVCRVGITEFAAKQLGDVTFVELPETGKALKAGDAAAAVESVKAASDVYAPVAGTVKETNPALEDAPEKVNDDPFGDGWFFALEGVDSAELDALMDAAAYAAYLESQED